MMKKSADLLFSNNTLLKYSMFLFLVIVIGNYNSIDYKKFIWFVLFSNCSITILYILVQFGSVVLDESLAPANKFINVLTLISSLFGILLFHSIAGAMLSFFAEMEPLSIFGRNGFINHFEVRDGVKYIYDNIYLFYPYILLKFKVLNFPLKKVNQFGQHIKEIPLLLLGAIAFPLLYLTLKKYHLPLSLSQFSFLGIGFLVFFPFELFFSKDIIELRSDKEAALDVELVMPLKIVEDRPKGWGGFIILFGLVFIIVGLGTFNIVALENSFSFFNLIIGSIFSAVFCGFGLIATIIGLNFQWGYRKFEINNKEVNGEERIFVPWKIDFKWKKNITEYNTVTKEKVHVSSDSGDYTQYEIVMKYKSDLEMPIIKKPWFKIKPNYDLIFYKAYHSEEFEKKYLEIKSFFENN